MCIHVRTVDTDVVVLALAMFERINTEEFRIAFGTGSNFNYIPVHSIAAEWIQEHVLFSMYSMFTGCDTTLALAGRGKKTAFNTWKLFPEVTAAFEDLLHCITVLVTLLKLMSSEYISLHESQEA